MWHSTKYKKSHVGHMITTGNTKGNEKDGSKSSEGGLKDSRSSRSSEWLKDDKRFTLKGSDSKEFVLAKLSLKDLEYDKKKWSNKPLLSWLEQRVLSSVLLSKKVSNSKLSIIKRNKRIQKSIKRKVAFCVLKENIQKV